MKCLLILIIALACQHSYAQMTQNLMISPKALSLGNAVTADPPGLQSIHYNPAGLTKLNGRQMSFQALTIKASSEATFNTPEGYEPGTDLLNFENDPTRGQTSKPAGALYIPGVGLSKSGLPISPLPSIFFSIKPPGSKFTFANGTYMISAGGAYKEDDDPGRYQGKQAAVQRLTYLSPSFGYQVNDKLSLGAGFHLSHQAFAAVQDARAVSFITAITEMIQEAFGCEEGGKGDDPLMPFLRMCGGLVGPYKDVGTMSVNMENTMSKSYNLGVLWEPTDWFAWGAAYQSEAKDTLSGPFEMDYSRGFAGYYSGMRQSLLGAINAATYGLPYGIDKDTGFVSMEYTQPQHFQTGIKLRFFDKLQVNIDAGWTDYDEWDSITLEFDRTIDAFRGARILSPQNVTETTTTSFMNMKSVWSFGLGLEYQLNSRLKARMGYEPRETSVNYDNRTISAPVSFADMYSIGLGYRWDLETEVDLSLSFLAFEQEILASEPSASLNTECLTCVSSNPYPGLDIRTKTTIATFGFTFRTMF